eukprot:136856-Hanusia_phi.AAC.1
MTRTVSATTELEVLSNQGQVSRSTQLSSTTESRRWHGDDRVCPGGPGPEPGSRAGDGVGVLDSRAAFVRSGIRTRRCGPGRTVRVIQPGITGCRQA